MKQIDIDDMSRLLRAAVGATSAAGRDQQPPRDAGENRVVSLMVDLMLTARSAGLSNEETGCLFLLLATNLLSDIPSETLAEMATTIRARVEIDLNREGQNHEPQTT